MNRRCIVAMVLGAMVLAQSAQGQDSANLRGDSAQTRKRLAEAEQKLLAGKPLDAADDLQRVHDDAGDELISVDGKQYRAARWIAHGILARLPESALKSYRDRIDDPARKLLATAKRTNDPAPLWDLLDRYFVSRPADEGLLLLGDLLFERGEYRSAERTWRRLLPDGGADLVYPGSQLDPATVRARIVLAIISQNDLERAARELIAFRKLHPDASGPFAGKTGPFADTLQGRLDHQPAIAPTARASADWSTFGGGVDRTGHLAARLSGQWPAQPTWQVKLQSGERHEDAPSGPPRRPPFSHPVVTRGHVFVTDGASVLGFHLLSGRQIPALKLASAPKVLNSRYPPPDPCPTLSADGDRLYARVGPGVIKSVKGQGDEESTIACVRIVSEGDGTCRLEEMWRLKPPRAEEGSLSAWEGAPLVSGRRMWAALARFEGGRIVHAVACYDPNDSAAAPDRPAWMMDVCDGPIGGGEGRARHELLTLAGRHVVFCSNTGAVIALDAAAGRRAWGFRYSRSRQIDAAQSPHPTPVVFSGGRLFVAAADGDAVYALDPESGQLLWQSGPMTGARIVGVSAGRVIVAVEGPVRGIRALSAENGSFQPPAGWILHDSAGLPGYGQGLVTDDTIAWPTRSGLIFLRLEDGTPLGDSRASPFIDSNSNYFGNVVCADGVLVVVGPTAAWAYVSEAREFGPLDTRTHRDPARMEFERVIDVAERALARGDTATAQRVLVEASRGKLPANFRAWAAARSVMIANTDQRGLPADVEEGLRDEWLFGPDGVPITLGELINRRLGRGSPVHLSRIAPKPCRREAPGSGSLDPSSDIVGTLRLPPGSTPLRGIPGARVRPSRLFVATAEEVLAVPLNRGDPSRFATTDSFTCTAELGNGFVAAGPSAVALYGMERTPQWVFRVPTTEVVPVHRASAHLYFGRDLVAPELTSFHLDGTRLIARLGERHLIAFDLSRRRIAWVLGADGSSGFRHGALPGARRIGPTFGVTERQLLVQLSDGTRWLVGTEDGKIAEENEAGDRTAKVWWRQRPVEIAANAVAVADRADLVRVVDLESGDTRWKHRLGGESSLTGDTPQVAVLPDALLLAVRRNHGVELDRLDPANGESVWTSGPAFLDADDVTLEHADADSELIVVPQGDSIAAISLETGRTLWRAELPETRNGLGWRVRIGRGCVIAYPEAAIPREPVADVFGRLRRSFEREPGLWRLPLILGGAYDAWVARSVPVVLLDPESGRRLVRFDIPAKGPAVAACFEGDRAVVATGDRVVWLR